MPGDGAVSLSTPSSSATILPREGAAAVDLVVAGAAVLARTPWADGVEPHDQPARDEDAWVRRWRGGWQACLPWTGPSPARGAFHGDASQAPWRLVDVRPDRARLRWEDRSGLVAERMWTLHADGLGVEAFLRNAAAADRPVAVAEHLVLGGDLLGPSGAVRVDLPVGTAIRPLAYDGAMLPPAAAGGFAADGTGWDGVGPRTGPRLAAALSPHPAEIVVTGGDLVVSVAWEGLEHLLLWDEPGLADGPAAFRGVRAFGVEPTTTPHGSGPDAGREMIVLAPGASLAWRTRLTVTTGRGGR